MTKFILRAPVKTNDTTLQKVTRDDLLKNDNGGVLFLADLGFPWSYPAGPLPRPAATPPVINSLIRNMVDNGVDAKSNGLANPLNITISGNGFDLSSATNANKSTAIEVPASVCEQLHANQEWLFCFYMKLPSTANWNQASNIKVMCFGAVDTYQNSPEIVLIGQGASTTPNLLTFRAGTGAGNAVQIGVTVPAGVGYFDDKVVQVAVWRKGGVFGGQIAVNAHKIIATPISMPNKNTDSFSGMKYKIGSVATTGFVGSGNSNRYRVYRAFIEDLSVSGRDPATVLADDLARVYARGIFS